jgi:hypothetical protein
MAVGNATYTPTSGTTDMSGVGAGGLSSERIADVMAKVLEKQNKDVSQKMQAAEGADEKQGNVAMVKLQQATGALNNTQSLATAMITGFNDTQKDTAKATR